VAVVPVAWTLTYELVFYMAFSVYILAGRAVFAVMTVGWGTLILAQWAGAVHVPHPVVLRPIVLQFLAGCLAAAVVKRLPPARTARWVILAGIVFVVVGMAENEQFLNDLETLRNWTAPCFLLIVAAACYDKAHPRQYPQTLLLLGEASYVIYLFHYVFLQALIELHRAHPWPTNPRVPLVVFVIVTLWVGCLIYRYVDLPLRVYLRRRLLHLPTLDRQTVR
jgi:peptidoglycan/LPS O-acetylase OafA/YrhL